MPTYDYLCDGCGHKFELFQSINDRLARKCPRCKKLKLRRLFGTGAAVVFKGSGFYQTDYRSDSYKKAASAESGSANGESKPAPEKSAESPGASPKSESGSGDKSTKSKSSEK